MTDARKVSKGQPALSTADLKHITKADLNKRLQTAERQLGEKAEALSEFHYDAEQSNAAVELLQEQGMKYDGHLSEWYTPKAKATATGIPKVPVEENEDFSTLFIQQNQNLQVYRVNLEYTLDLKSNCPVNAATMQTAKDQRHYAEIAVVLTDGEFDTDPIAPEVLPYDLVDANSPSSIDPALDILLVGQAAVVKFQDLSSIPVKIHRCEVTKQALEPIKFII